MGIYYMGSLFSSPKAPVVTPPAPMPTPDDAATQVAKKKAMSAAQSRAGSRSSTILSDYGQKDKFGG